MSIQLTTAQAAEKAAAAALKEHRQNCTCRGPGRRRAPCAWGDELAATWAQARTEVKHQTELDAAPVPGQGAMF